MIVRESLRKVQDAEAEAEAILAAARAEADGELFLARKAAAALVAAAGDLAREGIVRLREDARVQEAADLGKIREASNLEMGRIRVSAERNRAAAAAALAALVSRMPESGG